MMQQADKGYAAKGGGRVANRKASDTRDNLLVSARRLFACSRYENVKVSDIVAGASVSQGTFFYHFESKEAVLTAMLEDFFAKARALGESWSRTDDTSAESILAFARSVAKLVSENQDLVRIMAGELIGHDRRVADLIRKFYSDLYEQVTAAVEFGMRLGAVRPCDARIAAVAQVGMIKEVILDQLENKSGKDVNLEHIIAELIQLIYHGIRSPSFKE